MNPDLIAILAVERIRSLHETAALARRTAPAARPRARRGATLAPLLGVVRARFATIVATDESDAACATC